MNKDQEERHEPVVYVVLLNWNNWSDTAHCLRSVARLTYDCVETVVVDNASSDDSVARIRHAFPHVTMLVSGKNRGFAGGCNLGISHALERGADYVWLLNNDTVVSADALARMVEVGEADERVGAVGCVIHSMDEPARVLAWGGGWINTWTGRSGHYRAPPSSTGVDFLTGASLLVRASSVADVGMLDEDAFFMYWEDSDYCLKLRRNGWTLSVAGGAMVRHKEGAAVGNGSAMQDFYFSQSAARFFGRHARLAFIPISVGTAARMGKRLMLGNLSGLRATWRGTASGVRGWLREK